MSSIIATGIKKQTVRLIVSASCYNRDRFVHFLAISVCGGWDSAYLCGVTVLGRAQQSVWTHQTDSCDSAVLLLSVSFPLHCCNFFYLHCLSYSEPQGQWFQRVSYFSSPPSSGGCRGEWQINRLSSPWLWSECGWGGERREKYCF